MIPKKDKFGRPKFTTKQQRFVNAFNGNATEAAIKAGYSPKSAYEIGRQTLNKLEIAEAIAQREQKKQATLIWNREQRQQFWTEVASNEKFGLNERLKASELLGKSGADFIERREVDLNIHPEYDPVERAARVLAILQEARNAKKGNKS